MLNTEFSSQARKFLKKIDDINWKRLVQKIEKLRDDPFPSDVKRVVNRKEKTFRIRVGEYRI
jgi:mRNA-degrading endonuclease RelE of RelBE toxin-antitoxin system